VLFNLDEIKVHFTKLKFDDEYKNLMKKLQDKYDEIKHIEIPSLTFDDYKRVYEDGDRKSYENPYFLRREIMNVNAVLALIYPENQEYINKLQSVIWEICNEYYWGLPYHVEFDKNESAFIDLFAAETGCALAEIQWLLSDRFYPHINARITAELDRRIFKSFATRDFWWFDAVHNWASVCGGNVAVAMMRAKPELFTEMKPKFDKIMNSFLSGYDDDGMCKEGIGYWFYGFGSFLIYADMLQKISGGKYNYFEDAKVKEIALFGNKAYLGDTCCVSFSDGDMNSETDLAMYQLMHRIYPDKISPVSIEKAFIRYDRWIYFFRTFVYYKNYQLGEKTEKIKEGTVYKEGGEQYVRKNGYYSFAVKAGNNGEPHNHNDIGSFIVEKDDTQILCDLGAGLYTRQYFDNETRYSIFCNSSYGHSVPIVCGKPQGTGKEYYGKLTAKNDVVTIDMSKAYDNVSKLLRTFKISEPVLK